MIYIYSGDDRVKIQQEIKKILGKDYEIFEGENLETTDIYNICQGNNLFSATRKILIKDLTLARKAGEDKDSRTKREGGDRDFYEVLKNFTDTKHEIVIWETTLSQKKSYKEFIKDSKVKVFKFMKPEVDKWAVFKIFDLSYRDGKKAVSALNKLIEESKNGGKEIDPYMTLGAFSSSALKKFEEHPGRKEKRVLKELSKLDMLMKTTTYEPWVVISSFLLRVSSL